jgi:hypothetical protein
MRCTRCDGLAVPQAVGIDPDGRVVFGWCLQCLEAAGCRLVEVPVASPSQLRSSIVSRPQDRSGRTGSPAQTALNEAGWIVAIVAFLMLTWGLILMAVALFREPPLSPGGSPLGNGTPSLLGMGGAATALLGLVLLLGASRWVGRIGAFPLRFLSWLSFLAALAILTLGIIDYRPRRNVALVVGVGVALAVSVAARLLERSQRAHLRAGPLSWPDEILRPEKGRRGRRSSSRPD